MPRARRAPVVLLAGLLLALPLRLSAIEGMPEVLTMTTHNLYPYGSYQADGEFRGTAVDRLRCAAQALGIRLRVEVVPWTRAEAALLQGTVDGFFAASQNDIRDQHGVRSTKIADQTWQWFLLSDSPWAPDRPGFKDEAVVTSFLGANMQRHLEQQGYRLASPPVTNEALASMLTSGRIDAALANGLVMTAILERDHPQAQIKTYVLQEKPLYAYFGRGLTRRYPAFLPAFNQAIEACPPSRPEQPPPQR